MTSVEFGADNIELSRVFHLSDNDNGSVLACQ